MLISANFPQPFSLVKQRMTATPWRWMRLPFSPKRDYASIREIRENGTTVLLVEQNAKKAFDVSDRAYVLVNGVITMEGKSSELAQNEDVRKAYLGG